MLSDANLSLGSSGVAGALTGLLFVSLSIAPERLTGEHASAEQQSIAATAFTALVDALWISLFALRPGNDIPTASLVLGANRPDQHGWSHDQAVAGQRPGEAEQPLAVPAPGDHWPLRLPDIDGLFPPAAAWRRSRARRRSCSSSSGAASHVLGTARPARRRPA